MASNDPPGAIVFFPGMFNGNEHPFVVAWFPDKASTVIVDLEDKLERFKQFKGVEGGLEITCTTRGGWRLIKRVKQKTPTALALAARELADSLAMLLEIQAKTSKVRNMTDIRRMLE